MKIFAFILTFAFLLPLSVAAQEADFMKRMRSNRNRQYHKDGNRERYRALWNGNGAVVSSLPLWQSEDFQKELALTPEQYVGLDFMYSKEGSMGHWYQTKAKTDPVLAEMLAEHDPLNQEMRKDPYGEKTDPETERIYLEQLRNLTTYYFTETQKDVETLLTPEQMQKVRESELALMSEMPILNPSMFQSLDLTDEQRAQMEAIKKQLEPEFDAIVEELVDLQDKLGEMRWDFLLKNGVTLNERGRLVLDGKDFQGPVAEELMKRFQSDENIQKMSKRIKERAGNFMNGFKLKMLDVLTDEQLAKMQKIIDHPTEYVKKIRDRMQKERAEREKRDDWRPGLDSWRPGDPIPEEYLKKRKEKKTFPTQEQSVP